MQLQFKQAKKNNFPLQAVLIKGNIIQKWISEIDAMDIIAQKIYPISNFSKKEEEKDGFFGCLVVFASEDKLNKEKFRNNQLCQLVGTTLFLPEYTTIFPLLNEKELWDLCGENQYIFHPDFNLIELSDYVNLKDLLKIGMPTKDFQNSFKPKKPAKSVSIPKEVRAFQVKPISAEDYLQHLEETIFPKDRDAAQKEADFFNNKPLSFWEKEKLNLLKKAFGDRKDIKKDKDGNPILGDSNILHTLGKLKGVFSNESDQEFINNLYQSYEELEKRNQSKIDKLMELFETNPEEALKYAIPTDTEGTGRGTKEGELNLDKRWNDFGLFGTSNDRTGGGSAPLPDNTFHLLREKYRQTAKELIEKGDFRKAAFIYLKLLKERYTAASLLERGKFYQDAALIYLQSNNKEKAAECYEKGSMIKEAIELYKELQKDEKVGDLYLSIDKKKEANFYYQKVVDSHKESKRYISAALLYRNKMKQPMKGQELLMEGWESDIDAFNCLNNYLVNLRNDTDDERFIEEKLNYVYDTTILNNSDKPFLEVLRLEYNKKQSQKLTHSIREMAYKIIAKNIDNNATMAEHLKFFNPSDKMMEKETSRYRARR